MQHIVRLVARYDGPEQDVKPLIKSEMTLIKLKND